MHASTGQLTIRESAVRRSTFLGNSADASGGAVATSATTLSIDGADFVGNMAGQDGGAVFVDGGEADLGRVEMSGNAGTSGGALAVAAASSLTVDTSAFRGNSAVQVGGAIWADSVMNVDVLESQFFNNDVVSSAALGGAIGLDGNGPSAIKGCAFESNVAALSGGAVAFAGSFPLNVSFSAFDTNFVSGEGGAILVLAGALEVSNSEFIFNEAIDLNGGAISANGFGPATLESRDNVFFQNGTSFGGGGGAIRWAAAGGDSWVRDSGSTFDSNVAGGAGGGAIWSDARVVTFGSSFVGNIAALGGGAMQLGEGAVVTQSELVDNFAGSHGGALRLGGGGVFPGITVFSFLVDSSLLFDNQAASDGGAIYLETIEALWIENSTIHRNAAARDGGGIWSEALMDEPDLMEPEPGTDGPYQHWDSGAPAELETSESGVRISFSTITENQAAQRGGGLFLDATSHQLTSDHGPMAAIRSSVFTDNFAGVGPDCAKVEFSGVGVPVTRLVSNNFNYFGVVADGAPGCDANLAFRAGDLFEDDVGPHLLAPLADNGGRTRTLEPMVGSPLVDPTLSSCKGLAFPDLDGIAPLVPFDQRGFGYFRRLDGDGVGIRKCDIGAVEIGVGTLLPIDPDWMLDPPGDNARSAIDRMEGRIGEGASGPEKRKLEKASEQAQWFIDEMAAAAPDRVLAVGYLKVGVRVLENAVEDGKVPVDIAADPIELMHLAGSKQAWVVLAEARATEDVDADELRRAERTLGRGGVKYGEGEPKKAIRRYAKAILRAEVAMGLREPITEATLVEYDLPTDAEE